MTKKAMKGIDDKINRLHNILKGYGKVAVAFSGGVDSSLLLHCACDSLGKENVVAIHGRSCLIPNRGAKDTQAVLADHFSGRCQCHTVELFPLQWKEFVVNSDERCYFCKKRIYSHFLDKMDIFGCTALLDGTNVDDLKDRRPGLRAIRELGVKTPLLDAGLNKSEIRTLARQVGLSNHDLPSNSCLATRLTTGTKICKEQLNLIETAEDFLHELGFSGCRVKPFGDITLVEVLRSDLERFIERSQRNTVLHHFRSIGLNNVCLKVEGR